MKIALLNGPNLNMLGKREPGVYGSFTLADVEKRLKAIIDESGKNVELVAYQSNIEGELINFIHDAPENGIAAVIFNPGAYTHTSLALHDAIKSVNIDVVEVHISNIYKREEVRHHSYISPAAVGQISGFGIESYVLALRYLLDRCAE